MKKTTVERLMYSCSPEPNSGCWLWMGMTDKRGYGRIPINGVSRAAHRAMYEEVKGKVPDGMDLDHKCRVRNCINPDHLDPVTRKENCRRGIRGILTTHCPMGHEYNEENTYWNKTKFGGLSRHCKLCQTIKRRARGTKANPWYDIQRSKTHCPYGHEYTKENTGTYNGCRSCKTCCRLRKRKYDSDRKKPHVTA